MDDFVPTVGRIVHYVAFGTPGGEYKPEHRAAIVTDVWPDRTEIGLCVLNPSGIFFNKAERDESALLGGTWHQPERTE